MKNVKKIANEILAAKLPEIIRVKYEDGGRWSTNPKKN